ncbi:MAG: GDP-mannose 4,6-dehydratase [Calothrix sp. MO_167.B42]|nr:GDP-mannose 4,6-dehydratase [Calothrix sp. MO_167.B42]
MRILVTGGAGFIGSHLVRWLVEQGHAVKVLDNFSTGSPQLLGSAVKSIELIEGDIRDELTLNNAAADVEVIFHLAALVSVVESIENPFRAQEINATGTLQVLEAARKAGVGRVVQASSSAVYGNNENLPVSEMELPQPLSPYATTKLSAEYSGKLYTHLYDVETVALRFFNVYGPRQDPGSPYAAVIPRFIEALSAGKQPTIYGDGQQSRDFVFVGDIVRALWVAATTPGIAGEVFNVGLGNDISILELALGIGKILGVTVEPNFLPPRVGEVRKSCADVSLFAQKADFRVLTELSEGLEMTIAAWQEKLRQEKAGSKGGNSYMNVGV